MRPIIDSVKKYSFVLGLVIFVILVSKLNSAEIVESIKAIDIRLLLLALALAFPMLLLKTYCWNYIQRVQGIRYDIGDSFLMYCSALYVGLLVPGRVGDIARVLYLKKDGHSLGKSFTSVFLDRLSDLLFLLAFACLGSLFFFALLEQQFIILGIGLLGICGLLLIIFKTKLTRRLLKKAFLVIIPEKYRSSLRIHFQDFINDLKLYDLRNYSVILLITALSWLVYFVQMYILALGVGMHVSPYYLSLVVTIVGLVTILPASISGIGTRDVALIVLLSPLLIPREQIIIFSALILAMSLFAVLVGFVCWLIKPL